MALNLGSPRALLAEICLPSAAVAAPHTTITRNELESSGQLTAPSGERFANLPAFCRVAGILRPAADSEIRFEVWLPAKSAWNQRLLSVGNGGFAGQISYSQMAANLRLGYATAGTDTGHQANSEDASWAWHHPEKITDWAFRALHETTVTAKQVIRAYYSMPQRHAYFDSCSTGGRQGLLEAQRFPADFDGILAGAPANNWAHMMSSAVDIGHTMLGNPAGYLPEVKLPAIHRAVLAACDKLDGVEDGIVSDPRACHFEPASLACTGEDTLSCLTAPQLATLRKLYAGGSAADGRPIFPGYVPGSELPGWEYWVVGAGPGAAAGVRYPTNFFRYMVTDDPAWEPLHADAGASLAQAEAKLGKEVDATNPDLRPFFARGGKLILYHGWDDAAISPWNTIAYFEQVQKTVGAAAANRSLRLYMVPGMEHCVGGPGPDHFGQLGMPGANGPGSGALGKLERWVEQGEAPDAIVAGKFSKGGDASPSITRPLCPYPQTAHFDGRGDPSQAASFSCQDDANQASRSK